MNIIYIAYSCSPNYGSEDKIGWNIPIESAKTNRVFVITKEEHRSDIEKYLLEHKVDKISFYYVDIPNIYKKIFRGPIYSGRLNIWHKNALAIATEICIKEKIDVIHQITPIEFRSIGDYGSIPNVKFVCGPLGGGEYIPKGLRGYAGKNFIFELVRSGLNRWYRFKYRHNGRLRSCDYVLFANKETQHYLEGLFNKDKSGLFSEIGVLTEEISERETIRNCGEEPFMFLVACRMVYRKGISFLLDALKELPSSCFYNCRIVGTGPEFNRLKKKCDRLNLKDRVCFIGKIPYEQMKVEYTNADALIMPSIRETTGTVLIEAAAKGMPIITINKYGGAILFNEEAIFMYDGEDRQSFVKNLKDNIEFCIKEKERMEQRLEKMKKLIRKHTFENKNKYYQRIYEQILR